MSKKLAIKLALSGAMLWLVLHSVDLERLSRDLSAVSPLTMVSIVAIYVLSQVVTSLRWWIVTQGAGIKARFPTALSASFVGMYLNCFGLGTLGGDLARALLITDDPKQRQTSIATVVADRSFGLAVLATIGVSASLVYHTDRLDWRFSLVGGALILGVGAGWLVGPRLMRTLFRTSRWSEGVSRIMRGFPADPRIIASMVCVAVVFHLMQISLFDFIASSLGADIPWGFLLIAIPFANIASTLPLSWMGLGVRENVYLLFFVPAYLTREQVVLCGALWLVAMTASSAVGGIVAVVSGDLKLLRRKSEGLTDLDGNSVLEA